MSSRTPVKNIVVIGAGVVGLTTAVKIQEKGGFKVTIVAETFPTDAKSVRYTSPWAGAYQTVYTGTDERHRKLEKETFKVMWKMSAPGGDAEGCLRRLKSFDYFYDKADIPKTSMPSFRVLPEDELIPNAKMGWSFDTYTINPPAYLNYLLSRFLARGGTIVRALLHHVSQVVEGSPTVFSHGRASATPVDAVVACPGIGARTLGGIEDHNVFPIRGQTVIIHAPWIAAARGVTDLAVTKDTYIIPRPTGDVVLGGIREPNDWYPIPRPEETEDILQRTLDLNPELAPPEVRAKRAPTVNDLRPLIVDIGCGLRPGRKGGIRLQVDWTGTGEGERKIPMVFNYGHAGTGYESSWGSAAVALDLLEEALAQS
ncbi:D-amino-acid oxidase [Laetiporus sulphureus 93-53]|uniref:D-amino-acid oxidase n=1 Tax=Laetiporus sulphureus 93-53 TaxID=1314785 RepID=A0A165EZF0_9APHY|nr:D-amino-acid oxidase [Laetiporus sulphureus 93-53]KZT08039.1 D-amino-acid oxidase [Laetiporus sulphureus 93-53]